MAERAVRAGSFVFDVDRFENDPVVVAMSPMARAFYCRLLLRLWKAPEPGVVPDDDRVLRGMCEAGRSWSLVRNDIRAAFDATERPGFLIQQGMARTHREQTEWAQRKSDAGREAVAKRWVTHRSPIGNPKETILGSGSGSGSESPPLPTSSVAASPKSAPAAFLPTNRSGEEVAISDAEVREWSAAYPAVDVRAALPRIRAWLLANPERRKTARGMKRFVNSWLSREQDRPQPQATPDPENKLRESNEVVARVQAMLAEEET